MAIVEYANSAAILENCGTDAPNYAAFKYASLNGTSKTVKQFVETRQNKGLHAFNMALKSLEESNPKLHANLTAKPVPLSPEEATRERIQKVLKRLLPFAENSPQRETLMKVYEALQTMDKLAIYDIASEISQLDDLHIKKVQIFLHDAFGASFPKREFYDLVGEQRIKLERMSRRKPITTMRAIRATKYEKMKWKIEGMVPDVGVIALAGKGKIGKSWMGLDFGMALARGGVTMQSIQTPKEKVLYLALEDNEERLQQRANILLEREDDIEDLDNLLILNDFERLDKEGIAYLETIMQENPDIKTIIIDPWVKVKPRSRGNLNGYDADYESLDSIYRLAYKYKICVIIYFHLRKMDADDPLDALNATSGVGACVDGALILRRQRQEAAATLSRIGRIFEDDSDMALEFNGGVWKILDGDARAHSLGKERGEIIDLLNMKQYKEEGLTPVEIADALGKEDKRSNIRQLLMKMSRDEEVKKQGTKYFALISKENNENASNSDNTHNTDNSDNSDNRPITDRENKASVTTPVIAGERLLSFSEQTDNREEETDNQPVEPLEQVGKPKNVTPVIAVIAVIDDSQKNVKTPPPVIGNGLLLDREGA